MVAFSPSINSYREEATDDRAGCGGRLLDHPPLAAWADRVGHPDSAGGSCRSAADAVADVGGLRGVDDANDIQGDERGQQVEESAAGTE